MPRKLVFIQISATNSISHLLLYDPQYCIRGYGKKYIMRFSLLYELYRFVPTVHAYYTIMILLLLTIVRYIPVFCEDILEVFSEYWWICATLLITFPQILKLSNYPSSFQDIMDYFYGWFCYKRARKYKKHIKILSLIALNIHMYMTYSVYLSASTYQLLSSNSLSRRTVSF
jgi:hypothetical protein